MKRYLFIFTLLLLFSITAMGQDILTRRSGETMTGDVQLLSDSDGIPYAVVKNGKDKETVKLFDIQNISMPEFGLIKPMKIGEQYRFALLVSEDYLSVYKYSTSNRMDDFGMTALQKFGGAAFALPGIMGFKNLMTDYLSDCKEVSNKIEEKELKRGDIDQIVEDYNGCIALKNSTQQENVSYYNSTASRISETKEALLKDFDKLLKASKQVEDKNVVSEMLSDLTSKLKKGEKVPEYLINALKDAIKNDQKLLELMNKIIE
ncbi:hypothetical protein [Roseivirga sp.]|uniref:hypothetical protein n=1 Tax=Roseivirga sp. TaxID=1964215 RepID=UPI002B27B1DA|nr:hypothetical protein [Roseivirga sp.]